MSINILRIKVLEPAHLTGKQSLTDHVHIASILMLFRSEYFVFFKNTN